MPDKDAEKISKLSYVEDQVNELLKFRLESFGHLTKEAHITLNWFFGLIVASSGYSFKLAQDGRWLLFVPLVAVVFVSGIEALKLIQDALQAKQVPSLGNEPDELASDAALARSEYDLRLEHLKTFQSRINDFRKLNATKANAINRARRALLIIPMCGVGLALLLVVFWVWTNWLLTCGADRF